MLKLLWPKSCLMFMFYLFRKWYCNNLLSVVHFSSFKIWAYVNHFFKNVCRLLYHMMHQSYLKQQEAQLQYIWHVALTAPRSALLTYTMLCFDNFVCVCFDCLLFYDGLVCFQASIFVQSHVRAHVELMWLLCSSTPIGWLNRMIQFKEKSRKAVRHSLYDSFHHHLLAG